LEIIWALLIKNGVNHMSDTNQIPREEGIDHSLSLVREGYMFILNRLRSFNSNVFETRLLGKKAICMEGKEAAEIFYDTEKFKRKDAAPNRGIQTLFGKNGVCNCWALNQRCVKIHCFFCFAILKH
jgi:fatty-acid peroxygenase